MSKIACIRMGSFPFIYLESPVFHGRRNVAHFKDILRKISRRVGSWQNKFLSFDVSIFW